MRAALGPKSNPPVRMETRRALVEEFLASGKSGMVVFVGARTTASVFTAGLKACLRQMGAPAHAMQEQGSVSLFRVDKTP